MKIRKLFSFGMLLNMINCKRLFSLRGEDLRKDFARIQELLAIFPSALVSLFTATASQSTKEKIVKTLDIRDPWFTSKNPERPNIKYHKYDRLLSVRQLRRSGLWETGLQEDRRHYPLTFIYTDLESIGIDIGFWKLS